MGRGECQIIPKDLFDSIGEDGSPPNAISAQVAVALAAQWGVPMETWLDAGYTKSPTGQSLTYTGIKPGQGNYYTGQRRYGGYGGG